MLSRRGWFMASLVCGLVACGPSGSGSSRDGDDDDVAPSCGDGVCDASEGCDACASDCGACDWPPGWSALEGDVLTRVNEVRSQGASCGGVFAPPTHPLTWNDELALAARLHSLDMAEQDYFDHTSLDGRSPWDRIDDAGYTGFAVGENIAVGSETAEEVMQSWMSSPGHCRNIMSSDADELGVGYAYEADSTWVHYWTQTFGER